MAAARGEADDGAAEQVAVDGDEARALEGEHAVEVLDLVGVRRRLGAVQHVHGLTYVWTGGQCRS